MAAAMVHTHMHVACVWCLNTVLVLWDVIQSDSNRPYIALPWQYIHKCGADNDLWATLESALEPTRQIAPSVESFAANRIKGQNGVFD
jgi:hypothetical protein